MDTRRRVSRWLEKAKSIFLSVGRWLDKELDDARRQTFQVIAALVALLLLFSLIDETLVKRSPEAKTVAALVVSLLTAAFLAAYGKEVAGRIKKIGPIELMEGQKVARELDEIARKAIEAEQERQGEVFVLLKTQLSPSQQFYYQEGDRLLSHLKFSGSEPETGAERDTLWKLLFTIADTATTQTEWLKAIRWLEHLEKLPKGTYRPDEVNNWLAFSNLGAALNEKKDERSRQEYLRKTVQRFSVLAKKELLDYQGYYWLAFAQDELGQWYEAVLSNLKTLKRHPRFAPARYNLANSLLKLGKCGGSYWHLKKIDSQDEQIDKVATVAASDEEIRAKVATTCGSTAQKLLGELDRLSALEATLHPRP